MWETCCGLTPAGSGFAFPAGRRETLFPAVMFADVYPSRDGRAGMPPQILAAEVGRRRIARLMREHGIAGITGASAEV